MDLKELLIEFFFFYSSYAGFCLRLCDFVRLLNVLERQKPLNVKSRAIDSLIIQDELEAEFCD